MTKRGLTIAENIAAGAKTSLIANDELTLNVLVKDAMKDPDVAYVIVVGRGRQRPGPLRRARVGKPMARPTGAASRSATGR